MKIIITTDQHVNHFFNYQDFKSWVDKFSQAVDAENPSIHISLGDTGFPTLLQYPKEYEILFDKVPTYFVFGNHDFWSINRTGRKLTMDESFYKFKNYKKGNSLEVSLRDRTTYYRLGNVIICGTMGWACFQHPILKKFFYNFSDEYYDKQINPFTPDSDMIDLSKGWFHYTKIINESFIARLSLALEEEGITDVIIPTHYALFDEQIRLSTSSNAWAWFMDYTLGQDVKKLADRHPEIKFHVICGHSHEFTRNEWYKLDNINTIGVYNDYGRIETHFFEI